MGSFLRGTHPFQIFQQHISQFSVKRKQAILHLDSNHFLLISTYLKLGYQGFKFFSSVTPQLYLECLPMDFLLHLRPPLTILWFFIFITLIVFVFQCLFIIINNVTLIVVQCDLYGLIKRRTAHFFL